MHHCCCGSRGLEVTAEHQDGSQSDGLGHQDGVGDRVTYGVGPFIWLSCGHLVQLCGPFR
jgi:hypothetical protein